MRWIWQVLTAAAAAVTVVSYQKSSYRDQPLWPWDHVGSAAYVRVVNETSDTLKLWATAPKVDGALRPLPAVMPFDSADVKLPYADTKVTLYVEVTRVDVDGPATWRFVWR